jgi:hypothetical protein
MRKCSVQQNFFRLSEDEQTRTFVSVFLHKRHLTSEFIFLSTEFFRRYIITAFIGVGVF